MGINGGRERETDTHTVCLSSSVLRNLVLRAHSKLTVTTAILRCDPLDVQYTCQIVAVRAPLPRLGANRAEAKCTTLGRRLGQETEKQKEMQIRKVRKRNKGRMS